MADLETFDDGELKAVVRLKINTAIGRINSLPTPEQYSELNIRILELESAVTGLQSVTVDNLALDVGPIVEFGESHSPTVTWDIIGTATIASLTITPQGGSAIPLALDATSWTDPATVTNDKSYTVEVTDTEGRSHSAAITIDFRYRVFYGAAAAGTLDAAGILALSDSALSNGRAREMTIDASGGLYVFYAYPATLGAPSDVKAYGFSVTPAVHADVVVTTAAGFTGAYRVVRLPNALDDSAVDFEVF